MMNQKPEDVNQSPRSRTLDSLELQYQDFSLIATLLMYVYNDDTYIPQHYDVVQAFQWLWRSNERHFRLLHKDAISPRYKQYQDTTMPANRSGHWSSNKDKRETRQKTAGQHDWKK